jgi:hypothetical protein
MSILTFWISMETPVVIVTVATAIPLLIAIYLSAILLFSITNNQSRARAMPVQIYFIEGIEMAYLINE